MMLQTKEDSTNFITAAGIPPGDCHYASAFANNHLTESSLPGLTKEYLIDLGITIIGDTIIILKHIAESNQPVSNNNVITANPSNSCETIVKSTNISPPQLQAEMKHSQFLKFKADWNVYKQINHIPNINLAAQLYHLCDDTLQHNIVNTVANFFTLNQIDILQTLESTITKHSNLAVHHLNFSNLYQYEHESIKDSLVCLKTSPMDC